MTNNNNRKILNVPNLRFREFEGELEEATLGKITSAVSNRNTGNKKLPVYSINNKEGFLPQNEHFDGIDSNNRGYDISLYKIVGKNTFAYNPARINVGSIGFSGELQDIIISSLYVCFKAIDNVDNQFISQFFNTSYFNKSVQNNAEGGIRSYLFYENFSKIKIYVPIKREQPKIADLLRRIDDRISTQSQIIEELERLKKGLSSKLFSQELRFIESKQIWKIKFGNEIFENISDRNHNSDLPILAITQEYGAIPRDLIDYNVVVTDKSVEGYKVVQIGDFIISLRSFQGGIEYSNYKGICSPAYIVLRPTIPTNKFFYKYYLKTGSYITELNKNLEGIRDGKMISYKYFSEIPLPYPAIAEQTKIADFLSAIANKLETEKQILKKYTEQKKHLLANMFI